MLFAPSFFAENKFLAGFPQTTLFLRMVDGKELTKFRSSSSPKPSPPLLAHFLLRVCISAPRSHIVVGTLHIAVGVDFQHSISVSPIFCPSFGYHSFQTWVFRLCRVPGRGPFAENIAHSLSGKVWSFSPSGSCIHFLRARLFTVPCSYCVYSPFRAITKALANMAITKETVPAAAMVRATIPLQRVFFPTAGCTGW